MGTILGIEAELERAVFEKLQTFNAGRSADKGRYYILLPHDKNVYYTLWFYNPQATYHPYIFLETLELNVFSSLNKAIRLLANSYLPLWITNRADLLVAGFAGNGDDLITFGKYKGHRLQEVYTIDPRYVTWLSDKYEPRVKNEHRFKELAVTYKQVYFDLHIPRKYKIPVSQYVGKIGEKLSQLALTVIRVKIEDDPYKTSVINGTASFYVDQFITAADWNGNLYLFTVKATHRSLQSGVLSPYSHPYKAGEKLFLASAKVLKQFESRNVKYTKLGYIKFKREIPDK